MVTEDARLLDQRKKTLILRVNSMIISILVTRSHGGSRMGEDTWLYTRWVVVQKRNPKYRRETYFFKEVESFIMAIYMPVIATEGDTISVSQDIKQTFLSFQRNALLYCPGEFTLCMYLDSQRSA